MVIKKLHRKKANREMLLRNQVTSVLMYERIKTTLPKAKITKSLAEKIINLAKEGSLEGRRFVRGYLLDDLAVKKLYNELIPRLKERSSGYFRHFLLGNRIGDGARVVYLEIIDYKPVVKPTKDTEPETEKLATRFEKRQAKREERLTKDQVKSDVTTVVRKKGERRISNEK